MIGIDYVGVSTLVTAIAAAVASLIVAWRQVDLKEKANDIHAAVSMSNGTTLGGAIEKIDRATSTGDDKEEPLT